MSASPHEVYDSRLTQLIEEASTFEIQTEESTAAMKNLETFSKCRPPVPEPDPEPEPVINLTRWQRIKCGIAAAWDNETTRVIIKTVGSAGGVALVVYSTIHRDKVLDRQAIAQAQQRPN